MPPVLNPNQSKVDGLAFLGLSLSRKSDDDVGHSDSQTHQTEFDFNEILDRSYEYIFSTNDDGWLVGGGEPPHSYKLTANDSAHVEMMRIGTYEPQWGGVCQAEIIDVLRSGKILIPEMMVVPTAVVANGDVPPELEIRFDLVVDDAQHGDVLPVNWQLRFVHNQLFRHFQFPSRFCPGAFHSTIVRKAEFRSKDHEKAYFAKCAKAVARWRRAGPKPLRAQDRSGIETVYCKPKGSSSSTTSSAFGPSSCGPLLTPLLDIVDEMLTPTPADDLTSGIYLFRDRNTITHYFCPNFRPDTMEKVRLVRQVLAESWDESSLSWKGGVGGGGGAVARPPTDAASRDGPEAPGGNKKKDHTTDGAVETLGLKFNSSVPIHNKGKSSSSAHNNNNNKPAVAGSKKPSQERRGRPRQQKPIQQQQQQQLSPPLSPPTRRSPPAPVKSFGAKMTLRSRSLFQLHRRTPRGIVEEVPAAAAE
jgi:hypothetical protein